MAANSDKENKRRRELLKIQLDVQSRWAKSKVIEPDAGDRRPDPGEKFIGTFPFPYMNGSLHLGHAFSLSKLEFACAYHRLCGRNVLLPFAFHCTGMPIKASADKLARKIYLFGNPPQLPSDDEAARSQWEIMKRFGLSDEETAKFQNSGHWLDHFPPLAKDDLISFGLGCDWRRSFITTDRNPFYSSFVRWQMNTLKKMGKIIKDLRYTIYSPLDGQPCAGHDRGGSDEDVQPQDYLLIKMEVLRPFPDKLKAALEGRNVYLAAGDATLSPETMYGQTNCWVLPVGTYGAFEINESDVFVTTTRAARNLAYQKLSRVAEKPTCLVELSGRDLIGLPLRSPLAINDVIYSLPNLTISIDKGTGITTCVPSHSHTDYMALQDLKSNPAFRAEYGVKDEWVLPFDAVPIINISEFRDKSAEKVSVDPKVIRYKEKTAEAKRNDFTMLVGEYKGQKVQEARPLIKNMLLESGGAVMYSEPKNKVMSRSGDECVVALTDQWYITYGEEEWRKKTKECLSNMKLYGETPCRDFNQALSQLHQWACSRSFGLGTPLPWDEQFLVESLSDSTLYMVYYTVAHLLQKGDMYGSDTSSSDVEPHQMTDQVWDYIFRCGPAPESEIPMSLLNKMKQEFEYWYPFDLRVSGRDLIRNHLIFCLYNHTAIFPKDYWPHGFRCNGHIMLNSEKMSKSTGNFLTLRQAITEYSSDATRFVLADAADGMNDADFHFEASANPAIVKLTREIIWMKEILAADSSRRTGPPSTSADILFANEINNAIRSTEENYKGFMFHKALKTGFYDLQKARDKYIYCPPGGVNAKCEYINCPPGGVNGDLLRRFMDVQTRLIAPICPHYAEHVWQDLLKKDGSVLNSGWPAAEYQAPTLKHAGEYLKETIKTITSMKKRSGKQKKLIACFIFVNQEEYDGWRGQCLKILQSKFDEENSCFAADTHTEILEALKQSPVGQDTDINKIQKQCMPFVNRKMKEALDKVEGLTHGLPALDLKLPFDEIMVLQENIDSIKAKVGLHHIKILPASDPSATNKAEPFYSVLTKNPPFPGKPTPILLEEPQYPYIETQTESM